MRETFVDASAFITLAEIGRVELLQRVEGDVVMPAAVREEIVDGPAVSALERAVDDSRWLRVAGDPAPENVAVATEQLGHDDSVESLAGDTALLAHALVADEPLVVTDDKPLRKTCKALSVPVSDSIGVVIAAVDRGDLEPDEAKDALVAMDEVGARLSARLLRKAERLIGETAENRAE